MAKKNFGKALPPGTPSMPVREVGGDPRVDPPDYAVGRGPLPKSFFYKLDKRTSLPVDATISDNQARVDKKRDR